MIVRTSDQRSLQSGIAISDDAASRNLEGGPLRSVETLRATIKFCDFNVSWAAIFFVTPFGSSKRLLPSSQELDRREVGGRVGSRELGLLQVVSRDLKDYNRQCQIV